MVLPGFTNTADFPCITAAAAEMKKKLKYDYQMTKRYVPCKNTKIL